MISKYSCPHCNYNFESCQKNFHNNCFKNNCICYKPDNALFSSYYCRTNTLWVAPSYSYDININFNTNKTLIYFLNSFNKNNSKLILNLDYCLDFTITNNANKCLEYIENYIIYT